MTAPLGIFGGTFDPIHYGHLRLAEELGEALDCERVLVIPARVPPHRTAPGVSAAHRLEMVRIALAGNPRFALDDRECRRQGPSYTVDTLTELRAQHGDRVPLCLFMGADAFVALTTWSRWTRLFELAHLVIAHRPGAPLDPAQLDPALRAEFASRLSADESALQHAPAGRVAARPITPLAISGSEIRAAIRAGASPRYLLPDGVLDYIQDNRLYREVDAG